MDRRPFGNRGQYAAVPSTPRILGNESPRIQPLPRFRFAEWQRRGMLPPGLRPATLAKGYRWAHGGRSPYRDPERRACRAYNELELRLALEALALSSEQLLAGIWAAVLQRLQFPSTRMLLSQQARLVLLANGTALVDVVPSWLLCARSRLPWLREAFEAELGHPIAVILRGVGQ